MEKVENECVVMHAGGSLSLEKQLLSTVDMEEGSILLHTLLGEVCGTDVHLLHGRLNTVPYPIIPGHVAVGRVHKCQGSVCDVDGSLVSTPVLPFLMFLSDLSLKIVYPVVGSFGSDGSAQMVLQNVGMKGILDLKDATVWKPLEHWKKLPCSRLYVCLIGKILQVWKLFWKKLSFFPPLYMCDMEHPLEEPLQHWKKLYFYLSSGVILTCSNLEANWNIGSSCPSTSSIWKMLQFGSH